MKTITESEYNAKHSDFRGVWTNPEYPEYIGKRTILDYEPEHGTVLLIEDFSLKIIGGTRK